MNQTGASSNNWRLGASPENASAASRPPLVSRRSFPGAERADWQLKDWRDDPKPRRAYTWSGPGAAKRPRWKEDDDWRSRASSSQQHDNPEEASNIAETCEQPGPHLVPGKICFINEGINSDALHQQVVPGREIDILNHPVVILPFRATRPGCRVIATVTSFSGTPIDERFSKPGQESLKARYLPIARGEEDHGKGQMLRLEDGRKLPKRSYVNVYPRDLLEIETCFLPAFQRGGVEFNLSEASIDALELHIRGLRERLTKQTCKSRILEQARRAGWLGYGSSEQSPGECPAFFTRAQQAPRSPMLEAHSALIKHETCPGQILGPEYAQIATDIDQDVPQNPSVGQAFTMQHGSNWGPQHVLPVYDAGPGWSTTGHSNMSGLHQARTFDVFREHPSTIGYPQPSRWVFDPQRQIFQDIGSGWEWRYPAPYPSGGLYNTSGQVSLPPVPLLQPNHLEGLARGGWYQDPYWPQAVPQWLPSPNVVWPPANETGYPSQQARRHVYTSRVQSDGNVRPGGGAENGGLRQERTHPSTRPTARIPLGSICTNQQVRRGRKAEPHPVPGMICYLHKDIESQSLREQVRNGVDYAEILGHPVVVLAITAARSDEVFFAKVTTFGGKTAAEKFGSSDKTSRRFQREYLPISHGGPTQEEGFELQVENGRRMGARSWVNIGPKNVLRIESRHLPPFRRTTKQGVEYSLTADSLQKLMEHYWKLASISQTLGPGSPLRFGCCTKNAATNKSSQQEKTQGKPALHRLRANSTPSQAFQTGNSRYQKRDFAATQSPGGAHDEAEERYWRRRGAIRSTPMGGSPLNSPIEKPRLNYDTWILPSRIAFLPGVRKGSLLAGQVREKFHTQLARHPVVIMSAPNSRGVVAIALLTSLGGQTVQEKYSRLYAANPDRAREFGGDFLLIKYGDTQPHDDTPLLRLKDGKEMGRRSYVNVAYGNFYVQVEDLALYRKNGSGKDSEVFLDETSFQELHIVVIVMKTFAGITLTKDAIRSTGATDFDSKLFVMVFGIFWKFARVGERLSPYVSLCCVVMAGSLFMGA
ncbi:uncharacterized protein J3D65DRAFT_670901 [Phyllosticta citribraziliensis]|uniref:Uncharacterized protein n=1 Tax=Phyllosticta citribraziliensis TaxID=989973 RepID=A0ABR1LAL1_9PEZI